MSISIFMSESSLKEIKVTDTKMNYGGIMRKHFN